MITTSGTFLRVRVISVRIVLSFWFDDLDCLSGGDISQDGLDTRRKAGDEVIFPGGREPEMDLQRVSRKRPVSRRDLLETAKKRLLQLLEARSRSPSPSRSAMAMHLPWP
jgi:hypothetical protein